MQQSETIGALVAALAKAQTAINNPPLDKVNPHFKNRYASLAAHLDAIRQPLAAQGLAVVQGITTTETHIGVATMIAHSSGEWVRSEVSMQLPDRPTAQQIGSCVTYLRRYALACATLIVGDEDDDAEADRTSPSRESAPRYSYAGTRPAKDAPAAKPSASPTAPSKAVTPAKPHEGIRPKWKPTGTDVVLVEKCVDRDANQTAVLCSHPVDGKQWVCVPNTMLTNVKVGATMELDWEMREGKDGPYYVATRISPPPRLSEARAAATTRKPIAEEDVPF